MTGMKRITGMIRMTGMTGMLVFKPKYWADLFNCILFLLFFCLLLHCLAVRISLPFHIFLQVVIVLIQVYNWEIQHHSLVCRCGLADILYMTGMTRMTGMTKITGMTRMTRMTGKTRMPGMTRMTGMTGMTRMTGKTRMTGMTNMTGITGMTGMTGVTNMTEITKMTEMTGMTRVTGKTKLMRMTGMTRITRVEIPRTRIAHRLGYHGYCAGIHIFGNTKPVNCWGVANCIHMYT